MMHSHLLTRRLFSGVCCGLAMSLLLSSRCQSARAQTPPIEYADSQDASDSIRSTPLSPQASAAEIEVAKGYRVELVACEPAVVDPITIRFDDRGRMWVVEMRDYPTVAAGELPRGGTIKILEDRDGDSIYEWHQIFAEGLNFPTGLQPFRDGVVVTVAGEILYLADTDNDGVCDLREQWFTGFSQDNEQLRANHPTWTIENELHIASGLRGGTIQAADSRWSASEQPLSLAARDFSFSPWGGSYRATAGDSQFGFYQDDRGRSYVCSNRNPCDLLMADVDQVALNPLLPVALWRTQVMPAGEASRVYPLVDAWTTSNLHSGQFTAACSVFRYESDLLAAMLGNDFFACEPTGSLVQRYLTLADGLVPQTAPAHEASEFIASRDPWFRPVDLIDGPDGAIYIVDMHRAVIEHPAWMPDELRERQDMRWGNDCGRIYRVVPEESLANSSDNTQQAFDAAPAAWVPHLNSPNRWFRNTAARKIAERLSIESEAEPNSSLERGEILHALQQLIAVHAQDAAFSRGLVRGIWLLENVAPLELDSLPQLLQNPSVDVRLQAVRLLARRDESIAAREDLHASLLQDAHIAVRYQWMLEFARRLAPNEARLVVQLIQTTPADTIDDQQWMARAISLVPDSVAVAVVGRSIELQKDGNRPSSDSLTAMLAPLLRRLAWSGSGAVLEHLAPHTSDSAEHRKLTLSLFQAYAEGVAAGRRDWSDLLSQVSAESQEQLKNQLTNSVHAVTDEALPLEQRLACLQHIKYWRTTEVDQACRQILTERSDSLFVEVVPFLNLLADDALVNHLIARLKEFPPQAMQNTIRSLVAAPRTANLLLDALEQQRVPWSYVDASSLGRLERHPAADVASRFANLRQSIDTPTRTELIERYAASLKQPFDLPAGRSAFQKHCATCHRIASDGVAVGPDISDMRTQSPQQILASILDPNKAIDANYYRYSIMTVDGQIVDGLLVDSSDAAVTLKLNDGIVRTFERAAIEQLRASGVSMMPEGFENQLAPNAMNNLVHYLKRWRLLETAIPLDR